MARYSIDETTLTALGDAVRSKVGETEYRDVSYESRTYTLYKENDSLNAVLISWPTGAVSVKIKILDTNTSEGDRLFFGYVGLEGTTDTNALMYINTGETRIKRLIAFRKEPPKVNGGMPCGACREFLMQLSYENRNMEILTDYESRKTVLLKDIVPNWWGDKRYNS